MKNIYKYILLILIISCQEKESTNNKVSSKNTIIIKKVIQPEKISENKITIGDLNKLKTEYEGAGCYFMKEKELVFVDNSDNGALIQINGKLLKLEEISRIEKNKVSSTIYTSESFKIKLNLKSTETIDYSESFQGTLEIKDLKNNTLKINIDGECGC